MANEKHKERRIHAAKRFLNYLSPFMKQLIRLYPEVSVKRCQDLTPNECFQESEIIQSMSLTGLCHCQANFSCLQLNI
jgi:hypothetical protein